MKCEIIRDLLPSYMDGLTSEESNREIETHIGECTPCREFLQQMQENVKQKELDGKRKINPFRKWNRRMKRAIAIAVVICVCVGGMGYKAFGRGFSIDPAEITMDAQLDGNMLYLDFALENGGAIRYATMYDNTSASIDLRKAWTLSGDDSGADHFRWGMNLDMLTMDAGERVEVQMIDHSLVVVETPSENSLTIQNGDANETGILMFQEGEDMTSFILGGKENQLEQEYTVDICYGNRTESYTLQELLEMAEG